MEAVGVDHLRDTVRGKMHSPHHMLEFVHYHIEERDITTIAVFAE
jgi:hypothetical protein